MERLLETILMVVTTKEKKTIEQLALKLSEETGEVSQALLSYIQASGCEYKQLGIDDVKEECVDVIIVAISLFYKLQGTDSEMQSLMLKKISRWVEKMSSLQ